MASEPFDASQYADSPSPYVRAWAKRVEQQRGEAVEGDDTDDADERPEQLEVGR